MCLQINANLIFVVHVCGRINVKLNTQSHQDHNLVIANWLMPPFFHTNTDTKDKTNFYAFSISTVYVYVYVYFLFTLDN